MSVTLGLILRYDHTPEAQTFPSAASTGAQHEVQARAGGHRSHTQSPPSAFVAPSVAVQGVWIPPQGNAPVQTAATAPRQPSADRFPAYASTTYGSHGEPNRPWIPESSHLDLFA